MDAIARSFVKHVSGFRFAMMMAAAALYIFATVLTAPGLPFGPYNVDTDSTPSVAVVVE